MYEFSKCEAYKKLKNLSKTAIDLSLEGALTPSRVADFVAFGCGYQLLYATERVTKEVLEAFRLLSKEASLMEKMHEMQSGAVINSIHGFPSESRSVLHTATRDLFENSQTADPAKNAAQLSRQEINKLARFRDSVDRDYIFEDIILIGIGGSELGPKAMYRALSYLQRGNKKVYFLANVDPDDAVEILKKCRIQKTLVLVVSKSGSTLETLTNELFVRDYFQKEGVNPRNHFVAITTKDSPMDDKNQYLESFYMLDSVGGRYSSTSVVGAVLIALIFGMDVLMQFLRGANEMDKVACKSELEENLPLLGAMLGVWNRNFLGHQTLAILPYSQALDRFAAHVQQLDMESNGKQIDKFGRFVDFETGPIIWGEPGTNAQHSFFQSIHQGTTIVPVEFIGFKKSQNEVDIEVQNTTSQQKLLANLYAQIVALSVGKKSDNPNKEFKGNRPSHLLLGEQLTPYSLGALLSYFEHKVAFQGFIWNINSFDQEGVQLGKVLATQFIDRMKKNKNTNDEEGCSLVDAYLSR